MKRYIYILLSLSLALGAMTLTSCNDFLDRSPQGQFTEDDDPNALVNGKIYNVYTMMRNFNITAGTPAFAIHSFRSEDAEKGSISSDGSDIAEMYDDFIYTPTNGYWVDTGVRTMQSSSSAMTSLPLLKRVKQAAS